MRIEIETDGGADTSNITVNGIKQPLLNEFNMTIRAGRKVKLQLVREDQNGKPEFISYYGDDFKKYDEVHPIKK